MKFSFSKTIFLTAAMALLCAVCVGCGQPYAADGPSSVSSSQSEARPESDNVTSLPAESSSQPAESFVPRSIRMTRVCRRTTTPPPRR